MGRRYATAVCVLLVAAAGCSVFPAADGSSPETEGTLTPAPVAETTGKSGAASTETPPAAVFPPGVSPDGRVDPDRLFEAHVESLAGRSYTWVYRRTERSSGGEPVTGETRVAVDRRAGVVENRGFQSDMNNTLYLTRQGGYLRWHNDNRTRYGVRDVTVADRNHSFVEYSLRTFLPENGARTSIVERNGERYVRLYVDPRPPPPGLTEELLGSNLVWGFTLTAYVRTDGLVRGMAVEYNDRRAHVSWRYDYRAVGETTVSRPDWVSRAANESSPRATPSSRNPQNQNGTAAD